MNYKVEELLPVMAKLADKYTSKDSASVSYETARQLMEAILYCINECGNDGRAELPAGAFVDCMTAYEEGYRLTLDKVMQAKEIYHRIASDFDDYGCRNYRETIIEGMPQFFTKYDVRFEPQNHLLALDYPALMTDSGKNGIDLIMDYLAEIEYEQHFLKYFSRKAVTELLEYRCTDYRELYLDNICEAVLIRAAACMAADQDVKSLKLDEYDREAARTYFTEDTAERSEIHMGVLLDILEKNIMEDSYRGIFKDCAHEFTVRLRGGLQFF